MFIGSLPKTASLPVTCHRAEPLVEEFEIDPALHCHC
jgi:hypothetical protein